MSKVPDHDVFVIPSITDVAKQMAEATVNATGDFYRGPETTIIHYHRFNEDCKPSEQKHAFYDAEHTNGVIEDNVRVGG